MELIHHHLQFLLVVQQELKYQLKKHLKKKFQPKHNGSYR